MLIDVNHTMQLQYLKGLKYSILIIHIHLKEDNERWTVLYVIWMQNINSQGCCVVCKWYTANA